MLTHEGVLEILKAKGPLLPLQIVKELGGSNVTNSFFVGAVLSDLLGEGKIKISNVKISGGSPVYYVLGQEEKLQNYSKYLHEKEQRVFERLKQEKVIRDISAVAVERVALRSIKDFAIPFEINLNEKEIFWKWYLTPNDEAEILIKKILSDDSLDVSQEDNQKNNTNTVVRNDFEQLQNTPTQNNRFEYNNDINTNVNNNNNINKNNTNYNSNNNDNFTSISNSYPKKDNFQNNSSVQSEPNNNEFIVSNNDDNIDNNGDLNKLKTYKNDDNFSNINTSQFQQKSQKESFSSQKNTEPVEQEHKIISTPKFENKTNYRMEFKEKKDKQVVLSIEDDLLAKRIFKIFADHKIVVLETDIIKKNSEIELILKVPSVVGKVEFFCVAKNKKKNTDIDVNLAYLKAQQRNLPLLFLCQGELSKKGKEVIDDELKNAIFKKI